MASPSYLQQPSVSRQLAEVPSKLQAQVCQASGSVFVQPTQPPRVLLSRDGLQTFSLFCHAAGQLQGTASVFAGNHAIKSYSSKQPAEQAVEIVWQL